MTDRAHDEEKGTMWDRLRRRKVVQWEVAYAAGAWTLLQVIEYLGETYGWPAAIRQLAVPALALGSLFVLVVAWYHGDRGEQRVMRSEMAIIALLAFVSGGTLWLYGQRLASSEATPEAAAATDITDNADTRPAVAVLPFVNMSSDAANEYLADGIADTLLTMLAQAGDLRVIARTSSFSFKGKNEDVRTIGGLLGVGAVLEGSVQLADDQLRITTQLINTADGAHLWAEIYDRPASEIFKVQDEIAASVTRSLVVALAGKHSPDSIGTTNVAAYDAYLRGKALSLQRQSSTIAEAVAELEKAVELDPSFGRAWAELSRAYFLSSSNIFANTVGNLPPEQAAALQERAARRAVEVAPELGPAYAALAGALQESHPSEASQASARAVSLSPDDPDVLMTRALVLKYVDGKPGEALELRRYAVSLDPRNAGTRVTLGIALDSAGDLQEGLRQYREAMRVDPDYVRPYEISGNTLAMLLGQTDAAARLLRHAHALDPDSPGILLTLGYLYIVMAEATLVEQTRAELQKLDAHEVLQWVDVLQAYYADQPEAARAALLKALADNSKNPTAWTFLSAMPGTPEQAANDLEMLLAAYPDLPNAPPEATFDPLDALICLLARSGDVAQAQSVTRRWEPHWRTLPAVSWMSDSARNQSLARSLACAERYEEALTELEAVVAEGLRIDSRDLAIDPAYAGIRDEPRLRALSERLRAADAAAAARFRARPDLNETDVDALGR